MGTAGRKTAVIVGSLAAIGAALGSSAASWAEPARAAEVQPPDPRLPTLTVPSPCPGPACEAELRDPAEPTAQGLRVIYLNFDGVTLTASNTNDDARHNVSAILAGSTPAGQSRTIPAFSPAQMGNSGGLSRAQIINRVVNDLYAIHAPYNVEFVLERPQSGYYHMVVFGGSCSSVAGSSGCAGIALLDCGDLMPNNIVFVFPGSLRVADLAPTAAQEAAHAFGLAHTLDRTDVMYPTIQSQTIPNRFGAGQIPAGDSSCGNASFQDSHDMMMSIIGFRGQDTVPPSVTITAPEHGAVVSPGDQVTAEISDDSGTVVSAELLLNGELHGERQSPPWTFTIPADAPSGEILLTVRARDPSGNAGSDRIAVYQSSGEERSCTGDKQCRANERCSGNICVPESGELGSRCESNLDCQNGQCATLGDESRCSQPCDESTPCPSGFECRGEIACWPEEKTGGCAVAGGGGAGAGLMLLLVALLARRRARAQFIR